MLGRERRGAGTPGRALGALFAALFLSLPSLSAAQQITFTSATASWRDAQDSLPGSQPGDPVITNGVPTSSVSWGGSFPQSGYDVTITIPDPTMFPVADFSHRNFTVSPPWLTSIVLDIVLDFEIDGVQTGPLTFTFTFTHEETPNNLDPCPYPTPPGEGCTDRVTFLDAPIPTTFTVGGKTYTLGLTFLDGNGDPVDEFITREGDTVSTAELDVDFELVPPVLEVAKSGPATMTVGESGDFTLDVRNTGPNDAWNATIRDVLPDGATGGMCDATPQVLSAQVFASDGVTPVPGKGPLQAGTDFALAYAGAPTCELTLTMLSAASVVAEDERLIITYRTQLDGGTQGGVVLTNVAGATEWFDDDPSNPDRGIYARALSDGTVGVVDHEDAHTVTTDLADYLFEKTVVDPVSGAPLTTAAPGDTLRYRLRLENRMPGPLAGLGFADEIDRLNGSPLFQAGSLALVTVPAGADTSGTDPNGGAAGTGVVDVRDLSVAAGGSVVVEFDVTLVATIPDGTLATDQAELLFAGVSFGLSDDPGVNGAADPFVPGDEDPTVVQVVSAPAFQVEKTSMDLDGDPNLLLAGERLRYTITVVNVGSDDASDATLRDAIPLNTTYIAGSTTLNGAPLADVGGLPPLAAGAPIYAPSDPTPGVLAVGAVATLTFDVQVDAGLPDGTVISNQAFVSALAGGVVDQPSDDPGTATPDDPTRDVVGGVPLLFAAKSVVIGNDGSTLGQIDPGDVLHYTISVYNNGSVPATAAALTDSVPTNTTWVADSLQLNGLPVGVPDGGVSPLIAGIDIASSDLTPPLPLAGAGVLTPGESATIEFDVVVKNVPSGTLISNQAVVTTAEVPNLPTDGDGNPATGPEPTIVVVGDGQQLTISKQVAVVGGGPVLAGSELEYEVRVVNVATVPASDVVITDDLDAVTPGELTYVAGSATLNGSPVGVSVVGSLITADYSTTYGPLAPGGVIVLRFRATTDPGVAIGTTLTNMGQVAWDDPAQTATASVSVDVGRIPGVGALSGALWHDADFDRVQGSGERALVGWTVELLRDGQPLQTVVSDANGAYSMSGLPPNNLTGEQYELRFTAPGAGANTAALGVAESAFTNGLQRISDIVVTSGANLLGLNLPIDPNGAVYESVARTPVPGATLSLLDATGGTPLPPSCFDDPVQQGQVTGPEGYYKFSLNFSSGACPSGGAYRIEVVAPGAGFTPGYSVLIPPASGAGTAPFSVPACPGSPDDAVPATGQYCEVQASEFAPPTSVPGGAGTTYHVHVVFDASQVPGSSQIFNNHIPLDPALGAVVAITKTTPSVLVNRGSLVPYTITVNNQTGVELAGLGVLDRFPVGFRYVEGSAQVDGEPKEPTVAGNELVWDGLLLEAGGSLRVVLLLAVGGGVSEGEFTNVAQVTNGPAGPPLSPEAQATVRVVPDITFDCTDVLGKVFEDTNGNGYQDEGERGLPGVRLVTVRGLAATTDPYGRYRITCALVAREDRGSNFYLKLDDRTLPSGYRMTTRQLQVKRATRGKDLWIDFGAAIQRVVGLDLADAVFEPDSVAMREQWKPRIDLLIEQLDEARSILRLSYVADVEDPKLVDRRLDSVKKLITQAWKTRDRYPLTIETEVFWRRGAPRTPAAGLFERSATDALPPVGAGPPVVEEQPGKAVERHLPLDAPITKWSQDPELLETELADRLVQREVLAERPETVKLSNVIPPIHFESGVADIPVSYIERLRGILESMQHLHNVRLHLVGHTDDQPLSERLSKVFGDNEGLSRERAGEVAEHLQAALSLPPESISFSWAGDAQPIASNATPEGRAQNRRVEVEVWYDEIQEDVAVEDVVVPQEIKRVKICRTETVCKLRYRDGQARRARLRNLVPPLHFSDRGVDVPDEFVRQIAEGLHNLRNKQNVTVKLIGYTDDVPLTGREERIYGTPLALSKARSRRVALAIQDALDLPNAAIESDGRGATRPIASNETAVGRALNRRVEVEFWHDDPLQELPDEPQPCPDAADAERVTKVYDPPWGHITPLSVEDGRILVPEGFGAKLRRAMSDLSNESNVRLRFVGYTHNERLDRRTARVYGDDIGLSTARARRAMTRIQTELGLPDKRVEHEGRGYVQSNDVVNGGFIQDGTDRVDVQVVYDELALLDDYEGVEVTPITRELKPEEPLALNLMRITVDGEPIDDPGRSVADIQRCTDVAMDRAEMEFKFDDLASTPRLSVTAAPTSVPVAPVSDPAAGESVVRFRMYTNYAHFIDRAEVRIFEREASLRSEPLAVVEVDGGGLARWQPEPASFPAPMDPLKFVLRAYDAKGRFDETAPQVLWLIHGRPGWIGSPQGRAPAAAEGAPAPGEDAPPAEGAPAPGEDAPAPEAAPAPAAAETESAAGETAAPDEDAAEATGHAAAAAAAGEGDVGPLAPDLRDELLAGYGEGEPLTRNIPLGNVGTVRVHGSEVPPGHTVWVAGAPVPVDDEGNFVAETLLPAGMHTVEVAVLDEAGNGELFLRDLEFERSDWFYMGLADLTVSDHYTSGPAELFQGEDAPYDPDSYVDGRLAFYLNGKFGKGWKVTASADTREEPIEDLFSNFLDKSPDALLRRIDPDYTYPTFGDDSTVEQTAPTLGKFYLKLSKDENYALWGNFKIRYLDNELAHVDRGLYGGNLHYQTLSTTDFGEQRLILDGFAADPGTVPSREEFIGTGGSLYFLRRRDILIGSERIRIEARDKVSGLVTGVVHLRYGVDYDIDYFQGRIVLTEPLPTIVDDGLLVRNAGLSGNEAWLVVQYEFTPGLEGIDTLATGGNGQLWLTDFLKVGATANHNEEGSVDSNLYAGYATLRASTQSWLKAQVGWSEGLVSVSELSENGGFEFFGPAGAAAVEQPGNALGYRVDASVGLSDLFERFQGTLTAYGQHLDAGYTAPGQFAATDRNQAGGALELPVTRWLRLRAKADWLDQEAGLETHAEEADLAFQLSERWNLSAGVRNDDRQDDSAVVPVTQEEGARTDTVAQLEYDSLDRWRTYAFGQATVRATGNREYNNRGGVGGALRLNDAHSLNAEVSYGNLGLAVEVGTSYQQSELTRLYLNYVLQNERGLDGVYARTGNLVAGARTRFSDSGSVFVENRYQHSATSGLTRAVGFEFAPIERLSFGANWESGELKNRLTSAETTRNAGGAWIGYRFDKFRLSSGIEYISDKMEDLEGVVSDRETWLFRNNLEVQLNPDWRMLGKFNHAMSDSSLGDFFDGGYTEAVFGYAYRPVANDRLNALAKYTYFYNFPTTDQLSVNGTPAQFIQKSHIASLDVNYDLFRWFTLGGKYAYRRGEVSLDRDNPQFFNNNAHLYILRGDLRFLKNWEASAQGRLLHLPDLDERRAGALVVLYRYLGDHVKVGVGYNFTDFSDDLTDLSYDDQGWFLNILGTL